MSELSGFLRGDLAAAATAEDAALLEEAANKLDDARRYVGPPNTITVTMRDHEYEKETWGSPGLFSPKLRTIVLPRFTINGERRSDPTWQYMHEDGVSFAISRWTLNSGRVETYAEALEEARRPE